MNTRNKLINKRKYNGWSQEEVANKLGISQQLISLIEQGKRNPSLKMAKNMELLYETPMEELFPDIFLKLHTTNCNNKII